MKAVHDRQVQTDLNKLVHKFHRHYGGELDELLGEAHLIWARACNSYDPIFGASLRTWYRCKVWLGLQDQARRIAKREARRRAVDMTEMHESEHFDLREWQEELSGDAQMLVALVLDRPKPIRFHARAGRGECSPNAIKRALLSYLEEAGWTAARMMETFSEIGEALR